ncbi:MAG: dihydrolipoamide acetyltransferase family protein [bacterium]
MPSLGADMAEGTVIEWKVRVGETVERGQIVALVETEKADIDVEIWEDGVVAEIMVEPGRKVPVGTVLLRLADAAREPLPVPRPEPRAEPVPLPSAAPSPARVQPPPPPPPPPARLVPPSEPAARRVRASPAARAAARAASVDLAHVAGTGPDGAVLLRDLTQRSPPMTTPAEGGAPSPPAEAPRSDRALAMRRAIAAAMTRSKREIPHYYLGTHVDLSAATAWLEDHNRGRPPAARLVIAPLLVKAVALALRDFPDLNGYWVDDAFRAGAGIHVGVAIALRGGGLVAPAIHDADRASLVDLMAALADLVGRARKGGLKGSEMTDATITVTSMGDLGVETVYGVIYPPQVALVGFGTPARQPWAIENGVVSRWAVHATLAGDHRASDGHRGGRFLTAVAEKLAQPGAL